MSPGRGIDYCPYRANLEFGAVQYSDFSRVAYYEQSDSEEDGDNANKGEYSSALL